MKGTPTYPEPGHPAHVYYTCTHDPKNPRHAAARPDHPKTVKVREDHLLHVIAQFLDQRVFGPDRATHLAATLPVTHADDTARRERQAAELRKQLRKIDASETPTPARSSTWPTSPKTPPPSPRSGRGSSPASANSKQNAPRSPSS
jgi:hypothetical protein